jgi:hypothetical protein
VHKLSLIGPDPDKPEKTNYKSQITNNIQLPKTQIQKKSVFSRQRVVRK